MGTVEIGGLEIPAAGPVFLTALAIHVLAGLACVASGALAALSRKRHGWHPRAGTVYVLGIAVVFASAAVMAIVRWPHDVHLLAIATVALVTALAGRALRRRGRLAWHGSLMAGSYVALLTGFYVDNGARPPVWDALPPIAYWLLPAAIGFPLTWWALARHHLLRRR
ncbi:hypothetical protein Afil01_32430 [Actinorhabdospora filicis]|uniref:DUF2306 domain-containing protein n=1 Tax=Actinorhabdospora filicis TaxID=1785913 RepID=A0A9W6SMA6_9ACTN|nr:hypothetical protein [Actinorhabdospora filicis]GLZ78436.1 hypothetical protein Afil01_32430 [Actinorhabdospora filicis]